MADLRPLPEYANPPVSEVVLSVEFLPLEGWKGSHGGRFWAEIVQEYPQTEVQPMLPSQIEQFGEDVWKQRPVQVEFGDPDWARFWFIGEPPTRLIQVQRNRFIVNWRKIQGDEVYPRYVNDIRPRFQREWERFKGYVAAQQLGAVSVQQCEVTYINDIPQGQGWTTPADTARLFAPWSGKVTEGFLSSPEMLNIAGSFLMPEDQGRLHFIIQRAFRKTDESQILQLRLTARGRPRSGDTAGVLAWMDLGREWIVRGFTDLTTAEAHRLWRRIR